MPVIAAVAHSVPPHDVPQQVVREYAAHLFREDFPDRDRVLLTALDMLLLEV